MTVMVLSPSPSRWVNARRWATGCTAAWTDRKSTRLNSSHANISYAVFCLKKNKQTDFTNNPAGLSFYVSTVQVGTPVPAASLETVSALHIAGAVYEVVFRKGLTVVEL